MEGGNTLLEDNIVANNMVGINVNSGDNTISNNTIAGNRYGLKVTFGRHVLAGNTVVNNSYGILLFMSHDNLISNNKICNNAGPGISLEFTCSNNTIAGNIMVNNSYGVLQWYASQNSTITCNTFINNLYGILLSVSYNNLMYHNNFVNNTKQVFNEQNIRNTWDHGYPLGGNYWSDYTDTDLCSGPHQNETGGDGIGDTPYVLDSDNLDHYPLTKPYCGPYDIGITSPTISKTVIPQNNNVNVTLRIINYGLNQETIDFSVHANSTAICTQAITLPARNSTDIAFTWNTTGYDRGNYDLTITAEIPLDNDTSDNSFTFNVRISILGDIDGDDQVDIADIYTAATAYGSHPTHPKWNPNIDLNDDNSIDIMDIYLIAVNFGKTS